MRIFSGSTLATCAALWIGVVTPVSAETPITYTDAGRALFSFAVPDFWGVRTGGPREIEDTELGDIRGVARVMGIKPVTDDNVWMGFVSPAGVASIDDGLRYLDDIDKFLVKDPTVTSTSDTRIGGLPARVIRGTGTRDGRGINFTATIIDLPKGRVAVVVAILRDGADPTYVDDLNAVFASFRSLQ
ncbi:hypothetical protein RUE5091_00868 [Ruegeria denitrificans]|uniref:Uncharacterized protein n=1 Tax=Ruegeria denitrificans TaxID=1715692 RepID=A0A0P1I4B4_9RHOB|nr:hypothetical protein [Ruegeria denitrificans]CUJ89411.1 hypothetical protein RUE5091_00868 [Ruegeria denitrificans]